MPHCTHEWTFNFYSVIYTVQGGIFCYVEYFKEICVHLKPITSIFILHFVFWNLDFVFLKDKHF